MLPRALNEQNADSEQMLNTVMSRISSSINCHVPGQIVSFDPASQTATIQPTVRRRIRTEQGVHEMDYPLLTDVPVLMLGGGGHSLTMPVSDGDECLVLFSDVCIDAWFQSGGVQNQIIARSHDLSDGFALVGFRSKPNALENMNTSVPAISDLEIAGILFSEYVIGMQPHFEGETIVLGSYSSQEE